MAELLSDQGAPHLQLLLLTLMLICPSGSSFLVLEPSTAWGCCCRACSYIALLGAAPVLLRLLL